MIKRTFDVVVALIIAVASSPFWTLAALVIRLSEGPPVLHRAVRVGRDGRKFTLYKFRTMRSGLGPAITAARDPRVGRVGVVLRLIKVDELPQLWNVLRGDMSLVGPRPEDERYVARYTPEQRRLLGVRPGITSPATVAYRHEEAILARYSDPERAYEDQVLPAKLRLDLDWLKERSLLRDLKVLFDTVVAILASAPSSAEDTVELPMSRR